MKKMARLLKGSALQVYRDQMLFALIFAPYLVGIALRLLLPLADRLAMQYFNFSIQPYYIMADTFTLTMGSMMIGTMVGLLMLDERDEGIASYFSVTPAGGSAYLVSRLAIPFVYSLATILITMTFASLSSIGYVWMIAPAVASAFSGIYMSMLLVSIASNKVEGLAVSKLIGIVIFGIPLAWFATSSLKIIGYILPTFWIADMLIKAAEGNFTAYLTDFILGILCSSVWFAVLYRIFIRKIGQC